MQYQTHYSSPLGDILLAADETWLVGLWFAGQKYHGATLDSGAAVQENPVLAEAKRWLDIYFSGKEPDFQLPLQLMGTTFQQRVWDILRTVPYGQTVTYSQIAKQLSPNMSAQAVGGAVGRNPIAILVPCHRVVGADGSLTGYAGGVGRKAALLRLEAESQQALSKTDS